MRQVLAQNPVLLLFVVSGLGFLLGRVRLSTLRLGPAAVLFVGIALSAWDPRLHLPNLVTVFGLALFVYTLGLGSGPAFSMSIRHRGLQDNIFVLGVVIFAGLLSLFLGKMFHLSSSVAAGLFSGSLSSTPSLAAIVEEIRTGVPESALERALSGPVVAYTITYPGSAFGLILIIFGFQRFWRVDFTQEAKRLRYLGASAETLVTLAVRVSRKDVEGQRIYDLLHDRHWRVTFSRLKHLGKIYLVEGETRLTEGDELTLVGYDEDVQKVVNELGEQVPDTLSTDTKEFGQRRIFVSDTRIAGMRIRVIDLPRRFGARITIIRRGDLDILPTGDTQLELGDRVSVIARHERMQEVTGFLGDSYKKLSEIDIAVFSLGIAVGLALGEVRIPLPDGSFKLGSAGGPLLVGLVLGMLRRTGPIVWHLPYSANLTLRQLGLILFLAGVGTASGEEFAHTMLYETQFGLKLFLSGAIVTSLTGAMMLYVGYRVLRIPLSLLMGLVAGMQTQATILSFATDQTGNDIPTVGYASVYPTAVISKVLAAQLILSLSF